MDNILITGGTGALGREIIQQLLVGGRHITTISTNNKATLPAGVKIVNGDLTKPDSLKQVVSETDIIIHCASNPQNVQQVDIEGTRNLLSEIDKDKIRHFIYVSIAGVDVSDFPYYKAKYEVEQMIGSAGIPFTILRATQFHDLVLYRMIKPYDSGTSLNIPADLKFQSINIKEVAGKIVDLTSATPNNGIVIIGGPQVLTIEEMAQAYLDTFSKTYKLETEMMQGERFTMFRSGINLCKDHIFGVGTWQQFLIEILNHDKH